MDDLTALIKKRIKQKYSSTKRFSEESEIPQTTIVSALKKGVSGTSFSTVCKMCSMLDIKLVNGIYPVVMNEQMKNFILKFANLDDFGIHTVGTVLEMENNRCEAEAKAVAAAEAEAKRKARKTASILKEDEFPTKVAAEAFSEAFSKNEADV